MTVRVCVCVRALACGSVHARVGGRRVRRWASGGVLAYLRAWVAGGGCGAWVCRIAVLSSAMPRGAGLCRSVPILPSFAQRSAALCRAALTHVAACCHVGQPVPHRVGLHQARSGHATHAAPLRRAFATHRVAGTAWHNPNLKQTAPEGSVSDTCRRCCVAASAPAGAPARGCWLWRSRSGPARQLIPTLHGISPALPHPRAYQFVGPGSGSCWVEGRPTFRGPWGRVVRAG